MEAVGGASAIVGLAVPVFKCAKELRDRIKLVRLFYPLYPLRTFSFRALMSFSFCVLQVASENAGLSAALIEYEKDINLLESLYSNNKALFDQHELDTDLRELAEYVCCLPFAVCRRV